MIPRIPGQRPPSTPAIPPPPPPLPPPEEIHRPSGTRPDDNKTIKLTRSCDIMAEMKAMYDQPIDSDDQGPSYKKSNPFQPDMPKVVHNFTPQYASPQELRNAITIDIDSTYFDNYMKIEKEFYSAHRPTSEVYSTIKIQTIMDWKQRFYKKVFDYHEYAIERRDGTISTFTDSELPHLNPYDLRFLLVYFGKKLDMGVLCMEIFKRVKKALRDYIQDLSWADTELAKSFRIEDVELDNNPNTEIDNIEGYSNGTILQEPELGVICIYENKKQFFRISEVQKLSNLNLQYLIDVVLNIESLDENLKGYLVDIFCGRVNARDWVKECKKMAD